MPKYQIIRLVVLSLILVSFIQGAEDSAWAGRKRIREGSGGAGSSTTLLSLAEKIAVTRDVARDDDDREDGGEAEAEGEESPALDALSVLEYDYSELIELLEVKKVTVPVTVKSVFESRFEDFLMNVLTLTKDPARLGAQFWQAWVTVPSTAEVGKNHYLSLQIEEGPHRSEVVTATELDRVLDIKEAKRFFWIRIYEYNEMGEWPLLVQIWTDSLGRAAEITTLKKGSFISGTLLLKLAHSLRDYFCPDVFFIFDAAMQTLGSGDLSVSALMRLYYPLISAEGKTWYEELGGYSPLNFESLRGYGDLYSSPERALRFQNETIYRAAVQKLRATTLSEIRKSVFRLKSLADRKKILDQLILTYFGPEIDIEAGLGGFTLRDLAVRIYEATKREARADAVPLRPASQDLRDFYNKILYFEHSVVTHPSQAALRSYVLALRVVSWHCIWAVMKPEARAKWAESTRLVHEPEGAITPASFDAIIADVKDAVDVWPEVAPLVLRRKE